VANGSGNFSVILKTLGPQTITATDTVTASLKGTNSINMVSNAVTHFALNTPGNASTRATFGFTVNALDAANNPAAGYVGTVQFTSSDKTAQLPANTALPAGISGKLSATFETAGTQTITATDTSKASLTGTNSISVTAAGTLRINSTAPPSGTVGSRYDPYTVTICVIYQFIICLEHKKEYEYGSQLLGGGGIPPYNWSWAPATGSKLPSGLGIANPSSTSGCLHQDPQDNVLHVACIAGTPTQPGTYQVVVTMTDSGSPSVQTSTAYSITISDPPPPTVSGVAPPPAVENHPYSFTFTAGGYAPLTWSESGALPTGMSLDSSTGTLTGPPTQTGSFPISVTATDQFKQSSPATDFTIVVSAHGFLATGDMTTARDLHTATLLGSGTVLVAGGQQGNNGSPIVGTDLYDPAKGTFSSTGNLQTPRAAHTATLFTGAPNTGKVLITGGQTDSTGTATASAELYDPKAGTFASTGSMNTARSGHTATLLGNGKVLIVGGKGTADTPAALSSAELFDPTTGLFTSAGSLATARTAHTATLLANGDVLITGGTDINGKELASAEIYNPMTGIFGAVGTMTVARAGHTAVLFSSGPGSGKVLLAGGLDDTGKASNTAELFDPAAQSFTATTNMASAHANHTATLLSDGSTVLLAGGLDATGSATAVVELFYSTAGNFAGTGSLVTAREQHTATLLANGHVLVTGGLNGSALDSAELYQ
jgi:hypothetical protein